MSRSDTGARFASSLIVGLLLIPISAVGAYAIVSNSSTPASPPSTVAMTMAETTTTALETTTTSTGAETLVIEPVTASADDLATACGEDGLLLVEAEATGSLTDVQQAALDALRQVCAESGLELPGPPAPAPVVQTVTIQASHSTSTSSSGTDASTPTASYGDDDHDDDHDEYEHEDEHEHEHEHEHEDEDEGDD